MTYEQKKSENRAEEIFFKTTRKLWNVWKTVTFRNKVLLKITYEIVQTVV